MTEARSPSFILAAAGATFGLGLMIAASAAVAIFAPSLHHAWAPAAAAVIAGLPVFVALVRTRSRALATGVAVTVIVIAALILFPWHPRMRFVRDLESLRPGMSLDEVKTAMAPYMIGPGEKWGRSAVMEEQVLSMGRAAAGTLTFRWNADDPRYDSDWGVVTLEAGRVVRVEFIGD